MKWTVRRDHEGDGKLKIYPVTSKEKSRDDFCESWVVDDLETAKEQMQHAIDCGAHDEE